MVFGLLMSVLVTVRSRAALISVLVVMVLMTIKSRKILRKLLIAVTLIAAVSLLSSGLLQIALNSVRESVVMGYEFTDVDSLSGGRFGVYSEAIDIVKEYPFFGEISARDQSPRIPHNYLLNKAKRYGLVGGSLFIVFYGFMVVYIYKNIQAAKGMTFWGLPIFLLLIPFLISFLEYQHPYGPGTSQAFVYFMLGQYVLADFKTQLCGARKNGGLMRDNGERAADRQIRVPRRVAVSKGL
jgi:O-antigen ligase